MLRTTLDQLRARPGRLLASALAVLLGTTFVAAALTVGGTLRETVRSAFTAESGEADVVVQGQLTATELQRLADLPSVAAVAGERTVLLELGGRTALGRPAPADARLQGLPVTAGRLPASRGEIALAAGTAERLDLALGDEAALGVEEVSPGRAPLPVTVVGLLDVDGSPTRNGQPLLLADAGLLDELAGGEPYAGASLLADEGTSPEQLRTEVAALLQGGQDVLTGDQEADRAVGQLTDGVDVLTRALLGFAVLALVVSALVIANTFAILVAQRTRELALLRCLGATGGQVRRSVLVESAVLGLVASVAGTALGAALVAAGAAVVSARSLSVDPVFAVPGTALWVPVLAGTSVTVLAAFLPARRATRIAPLAALRPVTAPVVRSRTGVLRLLASAVLFLSGAAALVAGALLGSLPLGLLGGVVSAGGVLLGATLLVPRTVRLIGLLAARRGGVPLELAAANAVRDPSRTTATATALLVGSTLVALVSVGAATARTSVQDELDAALPVDALVTGLDPAVDASLSRTLADLDGVAATTQVRSAGVLLRGDDTTALEVRALDAAGADVLRDPELLADVRDGVLVVSTETLAQLDRQDGDELLLGTTGDPVVLRAGEGPLSTALATPTTLAALAPDAALTQVWLRIADGADPGKVLDTVEDASGGAFVSGPALERAALDRVLDTLLLVVTALLGVAVVIAVVGIANTLSLSELERRRESALLRALGLTRGQLRSMLAVEAVLVSVVGAALGVVLGTAYGWAGAATVLGGSVDAVRLALPAGQLGALLVLAVLAGLVASWLPGRRAASTSPVMVTGA